MSIEEQFIKAANKFGVSTQEMINAIMKMNEALSRLEYHANEITAIKDDLHDLRYEIENIQGGLNNRTAILEMKISDLQSALSEKTENIQSELDNRTAVLEMEISDLRSAMDAKTENPNQKGDLENFSQIEVNPFLPGFVDLDSEEYINQRPLWDFTVDF